MNRWGVRILGIFLVIAFLLLMLNLQKQLLMLQRMQQPATPTTTTR
jgi:hypothetical protein